MVTVADIGPVAPAAVGRRSYEANSLDFFAGGSLTLTAALSVAAV